MGISAARFARWVTRDLAGAGLCTARGARTGSAARTHLRSEVFATSLCSHCFLRLLGDAATRLASKHAYHWLCLLRRRRRKAATPAVWIARFLDSGPPPIVFTLGSAAVLDAGDFYEQSARAAEILNQRAVLLVGNDATQPARRATVPETICVAPYAPFSQLVSASIGDRASGRRWHDGTRARAGKPMLVMPYSHDQPDNARRVKHWEWHRSSIARLTQQSEPHALFRMLISESRIQQNARQTIARKMAEQNGAQRGMRRVGGSDALDASASVPNDMAGSFRVQKKQKASIRVPRSLQPRTNRLREGVLSDSRNILLSGD